MLSLLSTYAPTVALCILTFLTVRGLLAAIYATLIRPSKNLKKYVGMQQTGRGERRDIGTISLTLLFRLMCCVVVVIVVVRVNGPLSLVSQQSQ